jgi:hypothetical protein
MIRSVRSHESQAVAKANHFMGPSPRTYEALCDAAAETLKAYFPQECAAYFKNAGYA